MKELTVSLLKDEELDEGAIHMMEFKIDVSSEVINMMTSRYGKFSAFLTLCNRNDNNDNPPATGGSSFMSHYWPFVYEGPPTVTAVFPHKGSVMRNIDDFCVVV